MTPWDNYETGPSHLPIRVIALCQTQTTRTRCKSLALVVPLLGLDDFLEVMHALEGKLLQAIVLAVGGQDGDKTVTQRIENSCHFPFS